MKALCDVVRINLGITKIYLLEYDNGYLMIDTGYSSDYQKFVKALKDFKIDIKDIRYLFLTHHHDDHTGFAQKMKELYKVKLILHEKGIAYLRKGNSENLDSEKPLNKRIGIIMNIFSLFHGGYHFPPVIVDENDIVVSDDDSTILRQMGIKGEILYTPGHTTDSISLMMDNGEVFCGDVAMNFMKFAGSKYRPIYTSNLENVYKSWKKLMEKGAKMIYPSHGNPFSVEKLSYYFQKFNTQKKVI